MKNTFDELQKAGKENFEAFVKNASEATKNWQEIASTQSDFSKKLADETLDQVKKISAAKNIESATELQISYMTGLYKNSIEQFGKISDMYMDMNKSFWKPVETAVATATKAASTK